MWKSIVCVASAAVLFACQSTKSPDTGAGTGASAQNAVEIAPQVEGKTWRWVYTYDDREKYLERPHPNARALAGVFEKGSFRYNHSANRCGISYKFYAKDSVAFGDGHSTGACTEVCCDDSEFDYPLRARVQVQGDSMFMTMMQRRYAYVLLDSAHPYTPANPIALPEALKPTWRFEYQAGLLSNSKPLDPKTPLYGRFRADGSFTFNHDANSCSVEYTVYPDNFLVLGNRGNAACTRKCCDKSLFEFPRFSRYEIKGDTLYLRDDKNFSLYVYSRVP